MADTPASDFTRVRRMPKRGVYDRATVHAILDATPLCHVGHIVEGRPVVVPTFHWRHGDRVFWHGSSASRMLRANAAGGEVCLTVTLLDGFVLARSAFHHSANYRSLMCFGVPRLIDDPAEKEAAMQGFVERIAPGRWPLLRPVHQQEVKATSILALDLAEVSAKVRTGGPIDDDEDLAWPVWAGVVPLHLGLGEGTQEAGQPEGVASPSVRLAV